MVDSKSVLRKNVRSRLATLSMDEKVVRSLSLSTEVKRHLSVSGARVVALFSPLPSEPQIWPLVKELSLFMTVVLPRVEGEIMNFYCYNPDRMVCGALGVMEPDGGEPVMPYEIDVVVVPGVVFTKDGARMGRGKGYYDKYLSQHDFRGVKIGVCYAEQIVDVLPIEPHDVRMDVVLYK
ncbi:MAG: 5-formyltetrahydrofolate cyclo-ligase [Bacteroidaceae bacterium]|nr:5-formyltetrahydrofolate cyclo-ligase [Bacteroidaceae bacterium]